MLIEVSLDHLREARKPEVVGNRHGRSSLGLLHVVCFLAARQNVGGIIDDRGRVLSLLSSSLSSCHL